MATRRNGNVEILNGTPVHLKQVVVFHKYGDHEPEMRQWAGIAPGARGAEAMAVAYTTGESSKDWWIVGWQEDSDERWWFTDPPHRIWKQHNLSADDDGRTTTVTIRPNSVEWASPSGRSSTECLKHASRIHPELETTFLQRRGREMGTGIGEGVQEALEPSIRKFETAAMRLKPTVIGVGWRLALIFLATFTGAILIWKLLMG